MPRCLYIGVGSLLMALVIVPSKASGQSLDQLVRRARSFESDIAQLEERYLQPAILETRYKLESRFNSARVAHMLEDYEKASLLLVSVVRNPEIEQFDSYRQALYLLGDSLYEQRNYLAARKYLKQLLDLGPGPYYQKAVIRLLEVAAKSESYEGDKDDLYKKLETGPDAKLSAAVSYMRGKNLYEQEEYQRARTYLKRAARDDTYRHRATYLIGVTLAAQQQYDQARAPFQRIIQDFQSSNAQQRRIRHLAYIALGRLAYERNRLGQAIQRYRRVPRSSPHFEEALYELTWVLVSRKNYKEASRNADIFLYLSDPNPTFIPEMQLLKADLQLRLNRYDRARQSYREVIEQFGPVQQNIEDFLARQKDVQSFFETVVEQELSGREQSLLPRTVQRWIDQSDQMQRVRRTVDSIASMQRDIEQSRQALKEVEARLQSGARIQSFPKLAEGMAVGIETESELIRLREQLLAEEYQLLKSEMSAGERERWRQRRAELKTIRKRYEALPKDRKEVRNRSEYVRKQFQNLRSRLDQINREIEGQREQLDAVNTYIRKNFGEETPQERIDKINKLRRQARENLEKLEAREAELRNKIAVQQQKVGVGDKVTQKENEVRARYRKMLANQREFLQPFHSRVGSSRRRQLERIDEAWRALPAASERLQEFFAEMRRIVGRKAQNLRQTIARERKQLEAREKRLDQLAKRSKRATSRMAYRNFNRVKKQFDEIVLRGDVGLIDIAWQRKEGKTDKLTELRSRRRSKLNELRRSFQKMR